MCLGPGSDWETLGQGENCFPFLEQDHLLTAVEPEQHQRMVTVSLLHKNSIPG